MARVLKQTIQMDYKILIDLKKMEILEYVSDHNGIKLGTNNKLFRKINIWKLNTHKYSIGQIRNQKQKNF